MAAVVAVDVHFFHPSIPVPRIDKPLPCISYHRRPVDRALLPFFFPSQIRIKFRRCFTCSERDLQVKSPLRTVRIHARAVFKSHNKIVQPMAFHWHSEQHLKANQSGHSLLHQAWLVVVVVVVVVQ